MSAFICCDTHINAIVTYAVARNVSFFRAGQWHNITRHNAEEIGRILLDENVRSVVYRYEDSSPDFARESRDAASAYKFKPYRTPLRAVEVIKACDCLDYQSCETPDWESTIAWTILQAIKSACLCHLAGYESARWEITEDKPIRLAVQS